MAGKKLIRNTHIGRGQKKRLQDPNHGPVLRKPKAAVFGPKCENQKVNRRSQKMMHHDEDLRSSPTCNTNIIIHQL